MSNHIPHLAIGGGKRTRYVTDSAKQRRPLAPREELSVGQAEALTPFEVCRRGGGLGLLLRSKRAALLAHSSRALSGGADCGWPRRERDLPSPGLRPLARASPWAGTEGRKTLFSKNGWFGPDGAESEEPELSSGIGRL